MMMRKKKMLLGEERKIKKREKIHQEIAMI
jgi:hypothetical protein